MGSLSVSTHRGLVLWQGLLLAVSLLNFWSLATTAGVGIVSTNALEGKDVILHIRNKPPNVIRLVWYRGEGADKNRIIAFLTARKNYHLRGPPDGPVSINTDGSLWLRNVTMKDAGIYTIVVIQKNSKKQLMGCGCLRVYRPVRRPSLLADKLIIIENKDAVVLTCYAEEISTQWFFNGTNLQLTERMTLSPENRSLTIDPVKREDSGNYQCEVSNPVSSVKSAPLELNVKFE